MNRHTTYFEYDTNGRLIKDSVNTDMWGADPFNKRKNVKLYKCDGDKKQR